MKLLPFTDNGNLPCYVNPEQVTYIRGTTDNQTEINFPTKDWLIVNVPVGIVMQMLKGDEK